MSTYIVFYLYRKHWSEISLTHVLPMLSFVMCIIKATYLLKYTFGHIVFVSESYILYQKHVHFISEAEYPENCILGIR